MRQTTINEEDETEDNSEDGERGYRVRTGPGKPGKSWNLIIWIPGLESHGILVQVMESHGI